MKVLSALTPHRCSFVSALVSTPCHLLAQSSNASIGWVVTDSSGRQVPGLNSPLTATDSATVSKVPADQTGFLSFPNLPAGNYQMRVSAKGFKTLFKPASSFTSTIP